MNEGKCEIPDCKFYSDVDVYFNDLTDKSVCSSHASKLFWDDSAVSQIVPQHGGPSNVSWANPHRGKNVKATVKARILGPYYHWKTKEVIGYHVSLYLGSNRARVNTMILLEDLDMSGVSDD